MLLDADNTGESSKFAQAGLKLFQGDNNWIKVAHNRNADGGPTGSAPTYFEIAYESTMTPTARSVTRTGMGHRQPADVVVSGSCVPVRR